MPQTRPSMAASMLRSLGELEARLAHAEARTRRPKNCWPCMEGGLLERGIKAICQCRDELVVVPLDAPLPVLPEAKAFLKRNDWSRAARAFAWHRRSTRANSIAPDLLVVDAIRAPGPLSWTSSAASPHTNRTCCRSPGPRMMAAALVAAV